MSYRPEIDGLRAISVVAVILFHAGLPWLPGGYVGVDVFFVISGFLIAGIIHDDLVNDRFSVIRFYERRARRILPALYLVLACTTVAAFFILYPSQFKEFSRSLAAVVLFLSNVHFWEAVSGYFGATTELEPLLHTWSLAVEEQFYFILPWLLILMSKSLRHLVLPLLGILFGLSLALSIWGARNEPDVNFYFTFSRFWELLAGSMLAIFLYRKELHGNNALSLAGLGLLLASFVVYDSTIPFPSEYTLMPILGTVLILAFARPGTLVASLLSLPWMVGIGLVSYSAYLWHQPLFAFARVLELGSPSVALMTTLTLTSFGLAYLSWRFVEQPFRSRNTPCLPSRGAVFAMSGAVCAVFLAAGLLGQSDRVLEMRVNAVAQSELLPLLDTAGFSDPSGLKCFFDKQGSISEISSGCTIENSEFLIFGDSHAASLAHGLRALGRTSQLTAAACAPFIDHSFQAHPHCQSLFQLLPDMLEAAAPRYVVLHGDWLLAGKAGLTGFEQTFALVRSHAPAAEIIVLGGMPQWFPSLPEVLSIYSDPLTEGRRVTAQVGHIAELDRLLQAQSRANNTSFVSALANLCDGAECLAVVNRTGGEGRTAITFDYGHLSRSGAVFVAQELFGSTTVTAK